MANRLTHLLEQMDDAAMHIQTNTGTDDPATVCLRSAARELVQRPSTTSPVRAQADMAAGQVQTALTYMRMAPDTRARGDMIARLQQLERRLWGDVE